MKKALSFVLTAVLLLGLFSISATANEEITVYLDSKKIEFDQPPVTINDRTLVPMRALFEALGATVSWDEESQTATGYTPGILVEITIESDVIVKNTISKTIDVPAMIMNNRTLIPLRVVSECFGCQVDWNEETKTITITSKNTIQTIDWNDNYTYYGEVSNGKANGYGELRHKTNPDACFMGYFNNDVFMEGTHFIEEGYCEIGTFLDWKLSGNNCTIYSYGSVCRGNFTEGEIIGEAILIYENGDSYEGEVINNLTKHGYGTYTFANTKSTLEGNWDNDQANGIFTFYNAYYGAEYTGPYVNGKMHGKFTIRDLSDYESWTSWYYNGESCTEEYYNSQITTDNYLAFQKEAAPLYQELEDLDVWYEQETQEYLELLYANPLDTEIGKELYESIMGDYQEIENTVSGINNLNLDEWAAAESTRQQEALKQIGMQSFRDAYNAKLDAIYSTLQTSYDAQYNNIMSRIQTLKRKYGIEE